MTKREYGRILSAVLSSEACTRLAELIPGEAVKFRRLERFHLWFGPSRYSQDVSDGRVLMEIVFRTDLGIEVLRPNYGMLSLFVVDGGFPVRMYYVEDAQPLVAKTSRGIPKMLAKHREIFAPTLSCRHVDGPLSDSLAISEVIGSLLSMVPTFVDTSDLPNKMYWDGDRLAVRLPTPVEVGGFPRHFLSLHPEPRRIEREGWGEASLLSDLGDVAGRICGSTVAVGVPPNLMTALLGEVGH